jgi:2-polyprenyl-3-methyl-5-hydroxy-6-metoxy-1,4-benzoquinol methylase
MLLSKLDINPLLLARPAWVGTGSLVFDEEAQEMEQFIYHRPVLVSEIIDLLAPRPGMLVMDATCGGGGHTGAILRAGADVVALDQDPDALAFARNSPTSVIG